MSRVAAAVVRAVRPVSMAFISSTKSARNFSARASKAALVSPRVAPAPRRAVLALVYRSLTRSLA